MSGDGTDASCSLGARELKRRLLAIRILGRSSLIGREEEEDGRHRLRFRSDDEVRERLEEIIVAERDCCPQLQLSLAERDEELVLTIDARGPGREAAAQLAAAFERGPDVMPSFRPIPIESIPE